jgi:hypothetical protein
VTPASRLGFGEQQPCPARAGERHPALAAAEIDIFGECKAELVRVPANPFIVIADDQRNGSKPPRRVAHSSVTAKRPTIRRAAMS